MISEELKGIVDKFKEQGKMDFLEETTEEKISDFEKERSVKLPTKFKEWFQKYRQKENLDTVLTMGFLYNEIAALQNDMQQQLRTFLILEDFAHKVIVQQAKALQETHVLGILPYKLIRKTGECIQFFCFHDVSSSCWQQ